MRYVIDTCVFIDMNKNYPLGKNEFAFIWDRIQKMIIDGEMVVCEEVIEEIKDDDLKNWLKQFSIHYHKTSEDVQLSAREILKSFPNILDLKKNKSCADPFIIATAKNINAIVLTNESPNPSNSTLVRIPNVCSELNIQYTNLRSFIDKICV